MPPMYDNQQQPTRPLRAQPRWLGDEFFDHMIRSDAEFDDKALYIQMNAMETGVSPRELYPWHSREPAQAGAPVLQRRKRAKDPWLSPAGALRKLP